MHPQLEKLASLDLKEITNYDVHMLLADTIFVPTVCTIEPNTIIHRARCEKWYKKEDLTYPPTTHCIKHQRASLPSQSMFYGAFANKGQEELSRFIAIQEVARFTNNTCPIQDVTVAPWKTNYPIKALSLVHPKMYPNIKKNTCLFPLLKKYEETLANMQNTEKDEYDSNTLFLAQQFAKSVNDDRDYRISATLAANIVDVYKYEGIIYPSVMNSGQIGANIVLRPDVVDKKLEFGTPIQIKITDSSLVNNDNIDTFLQQLFL